MTSNRSPRVARLRHGVAQMPATVLRGSGGRFARRGKGSVTPKGPRSSAPGNASPNSPEINEATLGEATAGRVIVDVREAEPA